MNDGRQSWILAGLVGLFTLVHLSISNHLRMFSVSPNLAVTALLTACMFLDSSASLYLGFAVGLVESSFVGRFIGSLIVTRCLVAWLVSLLEDRIYRDYLLIAIVTVFAGSISMQLFFYLFAPQADFFRWFLSAILQATYNGIFSIPIFLLMRRCTRRREPVIGSSI